MSQEDIATKLKLSVRQVTAIETGDWSALPERTFTRGFMRSYARLVGLDPESVGIEQGTTQSIAATELKPTPEAIGEIAHESDHNGSRVARWAVPATLIAVLAGGAAYFQWGHLVSWQGKRDGAERQQGKVQSPVAQPQRHAPATPRPQCLSLCRRRAARQTAPPKTGLPRLQTSPGGSVTRVANTCAGTSHLAQLATVARAGRKAHHAYLQGEVVDRGAQQGRSHFSETAQPGTREFNGALPLSFTVGNASNVAVAVDGKAVRHERAHAQRRGPLPHRVIAGGGTAQQHEPIHLPRGRRVTRQVRIGHVVVGSDAPIMVQSMTNTDTADIQGTIDQVFALANAGSGSRSHHREFAGSRRCGRRHSRRSRQTALQCAAGG